MVCFLNPVKKNHQIKNKLKAIKSTKLIQILNYTKILLKVTEEKLLFYLLYSARPKN